MATSVAYEPHENVHQVEINVQSLDRTLVLTHEKPYVTDDPLVMAALDAPGQPVKRVAKADTKKEAREAAEAKAEAKS